MSTASNDPSTEILNSWKEIAIYLSRGVRTVQRWEAELKMPVRRPRGKGRSAVVAMRSELESWIKSRPLGMNVESTLQAAPPMMIEPLRASILELHERRDDITRSRDQMAVALAELMLNLRKMKRDSSVNSAPLSYAEVSAGATAA